MFLLYEIFLHIFHSGVSFNILILSATLIFILDKWHAIFASMILRWVNNFEVYEYQIGVSEGEHDFGIFIIYCFFLQISMKDKIKNYLNDSATR